VPSGNIARSLHRAGKKVLALASHVLLMRFETRDAPDDLLTFG
jgi:hypothetical protein